VTAFRCTERRIRLYSESEAVSKSFYRVCSLIRGNAHNRFMASRVPGISKFQSPGSASSPPPNTRFPGISRMAIENNNVTSIYDEQKAKIVAKQTPYLSALFWDSPKGRSYRTPPNLIREDQKTLGQRSPFGGSSQGTIRQTARIESTRLAVLQRRSTFVRPTRWSLAAKKVICSASKGVLCVTRCRLILRK
jgi:hypothetical protein